MLEPRSLKIFFCLFSVPYIRAKGYNEAEPMRLTCRELEKLGGYDLAKEDPGVYANMDMEVPREWPDIPLPTFKSQAEAAVAAATRSKTQEEASPPAPRSETVKELLEIHRSYVDVLFSMGVDPLKEYTERKAENILEAVKAGDIKCKVCSKSCSSTQKLKNHIRRRHVGKTPHFCGECNRYYGDSQSLKVHMRKHLDPEAKKAVTHICNTCQQSFSSLGKLNEHQEKHADIRCAYCNDSFAYHRTRKAHEAESCKQRPGVQKPTASEDPKAGTSKEDTPAPAPVPEKRWYCHKCDSDFGARRNLKKHLNNKHAGCDVALNAHR